MNENIFIQDHDSPFSTMKNLHVSRRLTFSMMNCVQVSWNLLATVLYSGWSGCSSTTQTFCCFISLQYGGSSTAKQTFENSLAPEKPHLHSPYSWYALKTWLSFVLLFYNLLIWSVQEGSYLSRRTFPKCEPWITQIRANYNACLKKKKPSQRLPGWSRE